MDPYGGENETCLQMAKVVPRMVIGPVGVWWQFGEPWQTVLVINGSTEKRLMDAVQKGGFHARWFITRIKTE